MSIRIITEQNLRKWLTDLVNSNKLVIAPQTDGDLITYQILHSIDNLELSGKKLDFPFKNFLFPQTEPVFRYRWEDGKIVVYEPIENDLGYSDKNEIVIFGALPCDAASIEILDRVFLTNPVDIFYSKRREKLTIVGIACLDPPPECFCNAVGLSPFSSKGCDILLTRMNVNLSNNFEIGTAYEIEIITEKGQALLENIKADWVEPSTEEQEQYLKSLKTQIYNQSIASMTPRRTVELKPDLLQNNFDNPLWEDVGRKCLSCGVCAYVCPTCHCYDLVDEGNLKEGYRCKNWDSCAFGHFTLHASGHNPRSTQLERYRQRLMHKFSYFLELTNTNMCVGCGRCTKFCPVGIDIYEVRQLWQ